MKTIEGTWSDTRGNLAAWGKLHLVLNQDAHVRGSSQIAPRSMTYQLDQFGTLMHGSKVWANDELDPVGTYYTATVTANGGGVIWGPVWMIISGPDPIDLTRLMPLKVIPPVDQMSTSLTVVPEFKAGIMDSPVLSELGSTHNVLVTVSDQFVLAPGPNVSLMGSVSQQSMTVSISIAPDIDLPPFFAGISDSNALGNTGPVSNAMYLVGGSNITLSGSTDPRGITVTLLGPSTLPGFTAGISAGNTQGIGSTVTNQLLLAGGANITLNRTTNSAGMTISILGAASHSFQAGLTGPNTIGVGGSVSNRLYLAGGNNITLEGTTNASGMTVTIEGAPGGAGTDGGVGGGTFAAGLGGGNVSGDLGPVEDRLYLAGGDNIVLSGSVNAGSMSVTISGAAGGGKFSIAQGTNANIITSSTSNATGTTVTLNGGRLSLYGSSNISVATASNTAGSSATFYYTGPTGGSGGAVSLIEGSNITISSTADASGTTATIHGASGAAGDIRPPFFVSYPGAGTNRAGLVLNQGSNIQFAQNNYTTHANSLSTSLPFYLTINARQLSVAAGQHISTATVTNTAGTTVTIDVTGIETSGGQSFLAGISGGNLAGTTGMVSDRLVLAGGPNVTLSGSTSLGSATVSVSAHPWPTLSLISAVGGTIQGAANANLSSLRLAAGSNILLNQSGNSVTINALATGGEATGGGGAVSFVEGENISITQDVVAGVGTTARIAAAPARFSAGMSSVSVNASLRTSFYGSSGPVTNQLMLVPSAHMSFSGSTNATGMTVSMSAPMGVMYRALSASGGTANGTNIGASWIPSGIRFIAGSNIMLSAASNASSDVSITINAAAASVTQRELSLVAGNTSYLTINSVTDSAGTTVTLDPKLVFQYGVRFTNTAGGTHAGTTAASNNRALTGGLRLVAGSNIILSGSSDSNDVFTASIVGARLSLATGSNISLATASNSLGTTATIHVTGISGGGGGALHLVEGSNIHISTTASGNDTTATIIGSAFWAGVSGNRPTVGSTAGQSWPNNEGLFLAGGSNVTLSAAAVAGGLQVTVDAAGGLRGVGISGGGAGSTSGNTQTVSNQLRLVAGSNITLSGATNSAGLTVTINGASGGAAAGAGVSNVYLSSAAGGAVSLNTALTNLRQLTLIAGSNVTLMGASGASDAEIIFNAASGGAGNPFNVGISSAGGGTTAGVSATRVMTDALRLVAGSNINLSATTNTAGMTVSIRGNDKLRFALAPGPGTTAGTLAAAEIANLRLVPGLGVQLSNVTDTVGATVTINAPHQFNFYVNDVEGSVIGQTALTRVDELLFGAGSNVTLEGGTYTYGTGVRVGDIRIHAGGGGGPDGGLPFGARISLGAGSGTTGGTSAGPGGAFLTGGLQLNAGNYISLWGGTDASGYLTVGINALNRAVLAGSNVVITTGSNTSSGWTTVNARSVSLAAGSNINLATTTNASGTVVTVNVTGLTGGAGGGISEIYLDQPGSGGGVTSGTNHMVNVGGLGFVAGANITLSGSSASHGGGWAEVQIIGPPSGAAPANNRSLGQVIPLLAGPIVETAFVKNSVLFWPIQPMGLGSNFTAVVLPLMFSVGSSGTQRGSVGISLGVYTRNGSMLSAAGLTHTSLSYSASGPMSWLGYQGFRNIVIPWNHHFDSAKDHWMAIRLTTNYTTPYHSMDVSAYCCQAPAIVNRWGVIPGMDTLGVQPVPGWGILNSTTLPSSVAMFLLHNEEDHLLNTPIMYFAGFSV